MISTVCESMAWILASIHPSGTVPRRPTAANNPHFAGRREQQVLYLQRGGRQRVARAGADMTVCRPASGAGLTPGDDRLQQAAGPFQVLAATELSGNEVGHPGVREGQDLRDDRVLVADDRNVAGAGRAFPV